MSDAQKLAQGLHERQMQFAPDQVTVVQRDRALDRDAPRQPGVVDEQFPTTGLTSYSEKDKEMVAKLELQPDPVTAPGYTRFGKLEAKDSDFKWYQKKQAMADKADFQAWFAKNFDLMSPAQKAWAKEKYPEFYAERKKLLKKQAKNVFKLANLKLHGIEDMDDLKTTYLAETGRLDLGPLQNLMNPEQGVGDAAIQQKKFQRGLANPFLVFGKSAVGADDVTGREKQAKMFATRSGYPDTALGLTSGFPPMGTSNANVGDTQWFSYMKQAVQQI